MKEKVAIITGGSRGIGKALVLKFLQQGFTVITCSRNPDQLLALSQEVQTEHPNQLLTMAADLSKRDHVEAFASFCLGYEAAPEVLIHNTGTFLPGAILAEEEGAFETLMQTNVASAYHLTRGIVPAMAKRKTGTVFVICSTASFVPYVNGGSYCISKFALLGMTKVLREELKSANVRVTAVLPGATLTDSWQGTDLPAKRFMQPEDLAETIWAAYSLPQSTVIEELIMRPMEGDI